MTNRFELLRDRARVLSPALSLVLLLGLLMLGLHHHRGGQEHFTCAACTVAQTSAVAEQAPQAIAVLSPIGERPFVATASAPRIVARTGVSPRAPPLG